MPWKAGSTPASPGMKTDTVLRLPALMMSSVETKTMIPISISPSATPTRVEIAIPRNVSHQTIPAQISVLAEVK